jgi:hypothetical protein
MVNDSAAILITWKLRETMRESFVPSLSPKNEEPLCVSDLSWRFPVMAVWTTFWRVSL